MKILFVGDVMLGRLVNEELKHKSAEYPWGDTLPLFQQAELRICNLECVISNVGEPWSTSPKVFHFRTDEKNIETLKSADINIISAANNHVLDYGYEALHRMLKIFKDNNLHYSGVGINAVEAIKPTNIDINSHKIAFIAITDNEAQWEAGPNMPGVAYIPINVNDNRAISLFNLIQKIKSEVNVLIISAHWGGNWGYEPPFDHVLFAHRLIDAGADIIFGHSCHIFRGIEFYKRKPIIYSAGDFIDDYAIDEIEQNDESFIFIVELDSQKITRLLLYPTIIKDFQARLAKGFKQQKIIAKMQQLCINLNTPTVWYEQGNYLEIKPQ